MWKRLFIALFCALLGYGFSSSNPLMPGAPVVNPPGGQGNYLPINNPTWTGAGAGPTLNLTGAAPALTFNGVAMGGSCTGSDFINAISASGVISCATPAGGGGGLPTPVSVANGGLGQGNAPTAGQILVAQSATLYGNVTPSGDVSAISTTGAFTVVSVNGVAGPFAPLTNPANGQNNYAPINAPAFTGLTTASQMQVANTLSAPTANFGTATIQTGGVLMLAGSAALYFNGIPPGGTCAAGSVVTSISNTIIPTCSTMASLGGALYAPLTNVAGGANNYAPIASPTLSNPTFSGTVTFPNGSIADAALASAYSGVGACPAGDFVTGLTRNAAPTCALPPGVATFAPITNPAGGANNYAPLASPNFTGTVSVGGVALGALYAPITNPAGGQNNYAPLASPTFTGTVTLPAGSITDANLANAYSGVGACAAGSVATTLNRNAAPTCSTLASLGGGLFAPLVNPANGQNNYAPLANPTFTGTVTMPDASTITAAGYNNVLGMGIGQAAGAAGQILMTQNINNTGPYISMTNPNAGANAGIGIAMFTGSGGNIYPTTFTAYGPGFSGNPALPASSAALLTSEPNGFSIGTNNLPNSINFKYGAVYAGGFNTNNVVPYTQTFTSAGTIVVQQNPALHPTIDGSTSTNISVANGGYTDFATGSGLAIITGSNGQWWTCLYMLGNQTAVLIPTVANCQSSTLAPSAGNWSVGFDGANGTYAIANNSGTNPATYSVVLIRSRPSP